MVVRRVLQAQIQLLMGQQLLLPEVEAIAPLIVIIAQIAVGQVDWLQLRLVALHFQVGMVALVALVAEANMEVEEVAALLGQVVQVVQAQFTMAILVELVEPLEQVHLEELPVEPEEMIKVKPLHSMAVMDLHQELAVVGQVILTIPMVLMYRDQELMEK